MKKTSYFFGVLALLLAFGGCNQKEKKLQKIIDEPTAEQVHTIGEIIAAAIDEDIDCYVSSINDTFLIIGRCDFTKNDLNKANETKKLQKKFLLSALCNDSPDLRDITQKIADVPAVIQLSYEDTLGHQLFTLDINNVELKEALSKKYKPTDVLSSLIELENAQSKPEEFIKLEGNYVVYGINDDNIISPLEELVGQDIADAKGSFLSNFKEGLKEGLIEERVRSRVGYLIKLMKKNDMGFVIRLYDREMDKSLDIVFEKEEIDKLIK